MNFQEVIEANIVDIFTRLNLTDFVNAKTAITGRDIKDVTSSKVNEMK